MNPVHSSIACLATAVLCAFLVGCAELQKTFKPLTDRMAAAEKAEKEAGLGLERTSFGALNPEVVPPGVRLCNPDRAAQTPALLAIKRATWGGALAWAINDPNGVALDPTLKKEELDFYMKITNSGKKTLVRVLKRTDSSIDFWFRDEAVPYADEAQGAADAYCKSRDKTKAKYRGYSGQCGQPYDPTSGMVTVGGRKVMTYPEERIVAFDCI